MCHLRHLNVLVESLKRLEALVFQIITCTLPQGNDMADDATLSRKGWEECGAILTMRQFSSLPKDLPPMISQLRSVLD
jgi:hypothetical protein